MSKSTAKQDFKIILDFILEYGGENSLPNMDKGGSGDIAYEAALRLSNKETSND